MDVDQPPPSTPRKVRFAPKAPPRKTPKPLDLKAEVVDEATVTAPGDDEAAQSLRRLVNIIELPLNPEQERLGRRGPKVEKKSSVQVAFGHGSASSASIRTYGIPREGNSGKSKISGSKEPASADGQILFSLPSTDEPNGTAGSFQKNAVGASYQKEKKDYREPWDYNHTNYPISLPWRRPYSGDPELLDEAEFGNDAADLEYDENTTNSALELGLLEDSEKPQMMFFQFPANLPLVKPSGSADGKKDKTESSKPLGSKGASANRAKGKEITTSSGDITGYSASVKGKEIVGSSPVPVGNGDDDDSKMCCSLEDLPGGYMGKMLIYKSGAIKWKLGNVIYDVSPGLSCISAQDVVAINTADKTCCALGKVGKRVVVTPDVDSLLDKVIDLG